MVSNIDHMQAISKELSVSQSIVAHLNRELSEVDSQLTALREKREGIQAVLASASRSLGVRQPYRHLYVVNSQPDRRSA